MHTHTLTSTEPPSLSAGVKLVPSNSVDWRISAHAEPLCVASYMYIIHAIVRMCKHGKI